MKLKTKPSLCVSWLPPLWQCDNITHLDPIATLWQYSRIPLYSYIWLIVSFVFRCLAQYSAWSILMRVHPWRWVSAVSHKQIRYIPRHMPLDGTRPTSSITNPWTLSSQQKLGGPVESSWRLMRNIMRSMLSTCLELLDCAWNQCWCFWYPTLLSLNEILCARTPHHNE